jgi:prevent-host-death family protein
MKTISAVEARTNLGRILNIVSLTHADIIIERAGKQIARLTSVDEPAASRSSGKLDWRKARGLGKSVWRRVNNVEAYIQKERDQWQ